MPNNVDGTMPFKVESDTRNAWITTPDLPLIMTEVDAR
jgi:hypothetical protein